MKQMLLGLLLTAGLSNDALAWCILNCEKDNFVSACSRKVGTSAASNACACIYDYVAKELTADQIKSMTAGFNNDQKAVNELYEKNGFMWGAATGGQIQDMMNRMKSQHICGS